MIKAKWSDTAQARDYPNPIVDVRSMVRAEVLRRMRSAGASETFERCVSKVIARVEQELSALENAL